MGNQRKKNAQKHYYGCVAKAKFRYLKDLSNRFFIKSQRNRSRRRVGSLMSWV